MARLAPTYRLTLLSMATLVTLGVACGTATPEPPPTPAGAVSEFRAGAPGDLASYRYRVAIRATADLIDTSGAPPGLDFSNFVTVIVLEGERVNPDRERTRSHTDLGYFEIDRETVVIGARAWVREGTGIWRESLPLTAPEDFLGQNVALSPSEMLRPQSLEDLPRVTEVLRSLPSTAEVVNGRPALHWSLDSEQVARLLGRRDVLPGMLEPEAVHLELWGDVETGVTLRVVFTAASKEQPRAVEVEIDMFDLNDAAIEVVPPPVAPGTAISRGR